MHNHFKVYNSLQQNIEYKNMELIQLKENWYNISGVRYGDQKIKGGKPIDIADQLHWITEKEKELQATINYMKELRRIHEKEIDKVDDPKKRTILKLFYLDKCTIRQISACMRLSDGHVKKLKRKAVAEFLEKNGGD